MLDAVTYGVTGTFCLLATRQASTPAATGLCAVVGSLFALSATAAAAGWPASARGQVAAGVGLRLAFAGLHNVIVRLNRHYKMVLPIRSWPAFFAARTGPLMFVVVNAWAGLPRGRRLAALLAAEWLALAATQAGACASQAGWTMDYAFFYNRAVDALDAATAVARAAVLGGTGGGGGRRGGGGECAGGDAATPAASMPRSTLNMCTVHSCRLVLGSMYAAGAALCYWLASPPPRPRPRLAAVAAEDGSSSAPPRPPWPASSASPDAMPPHWRRAVDLLETAASAVLVAATVAVSAWSVAGVVLPRPPWCEGAAAAVGWAALERGG